MSRASHPEPPPDLEKRELPLLTISEKTVLYRIHGERHGPIFFGPPTNRPQSRFDAPAGEYRVCYLGREREAAFVETLLREPTRRLLAWPDIDTRMLTAVEVRKALRLVEFFGPSLRRLAATAEVASTRDYVLSRAWSRALWSHRQGPDGILYRCRHDDSVFGIALFDRAGEKVRLLHTTPLSRETDWLGTLARRYDFGLTF